MQTHQERKHAKHASMQAHQARNLADSIMGELEKEQNSYSTEQPFVEYLN